MLEIKLTLCGSGILRAYTAAATCESVPFLATCSLCGERRLQLPYSLADLLMRLERSAPIDAYCIPCDRLWEIGARDRAAIVRGLVGLKIVFRQ